MKRDFNVKYWSKEKEEKCPVSYEMCRKEDVRHRWNQMSVTGTESIMIILGQKLSWNKKL